MKNWNLLAVLCLAVFVNAVRADEKPEPVKPPKGQELYVIKLAEPAGEGFVGPGSLVKLTFTHKNKTYVVAENLLVYAVDMTNDSTETVYSLGMTKEQIAKAAERLKSGERPELILQKPQDK